MKLCIREKGTDYLAYVDGFHHFLNFMSMKFKLMKFEICKDYVYFKKGIKNVISRENKNVNGFFMAGSNSAKTARKNKNNFDNGWILVVFLNEQIIVN